MGITEIVLIVVFIMILLIIIGSIVEKNESGKPNKSKIVSTESGGGLDIVDVIALKVLHDKFSDENDDCDDDDD